MLAPLARASGAVDEVVPADGLAEPLHRRLHGAGLAVNLHGRGPESHDLLLATEPRRLVAFAHPAVPASSQGPRWRPDEHEVARWCRLLAESGIAADPGRLDLELPPGPVPHGAAGATLVHPGAASPSRRWPPERFAEVARAELAAGRRVIVTGGPDEVDLANDVAARAGLPASAVHAGQGGVLTIGRLVAAADRVVCGDTGVAHLATALRTPRWCCSAPPPRPCGARPPTGPGTAPCGPAAAATRTASSPTPACWPSTSTRSPRPWPASPGRRPPPRPPGNRPRPGRLAPDRTPTG